MYDIPSLLLVNSIHPVRFLAKSAIKNEIAGRDIFSGRTMRAAEEIEY